jgi:hypothetical protein
MESNVSELRAHRSAPERGLVVLCAANNYDSV